MKDAWSRIWALIERDLRRFRRSPTLMVVSMILPLVQLIVLGNAFGGKIKNLKLGVVDQDYRQPAVRLKGMLNAVTVNAQTFRPVPYCDMGQAMRDLKNGKINAVLNIPPDFSRYDLSAQNPTVALIVDNTDQFSSSALTTSLTDLLQAYDAKPSFSRRNHDATLSVVEVYPYVPYIQFFLPGTIVLAVFISCMIGGGIMYIDDKARGLHEGYLTTPLTKFDLIMGFNLSGAMKAMLSGFVLITIGSLIAGIPHPLDPLRLARMLVLVAFTSLALISMMFLIMVRVNDPLVPRAIFGVLNVVLFFPSGAVYPIQAFPAWMRDFSVINPFTYAVDGFKSLVLKNTGLTAISGDILFLAAFALLSMAAATRLFRRTI
ncbi:MAG: ABC transporter permease [Syntrophobacteraceae bacterium]